MKNPKLSFYHANARGTGCALFLELIPAKWCEDGYVIMTLANQTVDKNEKPPVFPTFEMGNPIVVKLDFMDLSKILQVLRGECESIDDGRGLYHRSASTTTAIRFSHVLDPMCGYTLDVTRMTNGKRDEEHATIVLTSAEACGLAEALRMALGLVAFGAPPPTYV